MQASRLALAATNLTIRNFAQTWPAKPICIHDLPAGSDAVTRRRFGEEGAGLDLDTPEQVAALINEGIPRWGEVVNESGARVD
jgi:hypothetical protein